MTEGTSSRGQILPYSVVAGVTPCGQGWLVAGAKLHGTTFAPEEPRVIKTFGEVLDQRPTFSVVALNAPVGYPDESTPQGRSCDREARSLIGRRGAAVRSAPFRATLSGGVGSGGKKLDAVTLSLLPRYREVATEMAPYRQRTVFEVHSELSFYQLNDDEPLVSSKNSEEGQKERRVLLENRIPGVDRILESDIDGVSYSHLLDAAAFMWTARRIFARIGVRVPEEPEWDQEGLRMEIFR